jgi:hypothetical protein
MKTVAMAVATALVLAGCGRKDAQQAAAPAGSAAPSASVAAGSGLDQNAVAAVLQSPGAPVAALSFLIESRPVVDKPFALKLLATAAQPLPALQLGVESASLIVSPANGVLAIEDAGKPVSYELVVTAPAAGLTQLTVSLKGEELPVTEYAIPVLVSEAAAE